MASGRKPPSDREYLALLELQLAELHAEARRLNRRLRNIRLALRDCEEGLAAAHAGVKAHLHRDPQ